MEEEEDEEQERGRGKIRIVERNKRKKIVKEANIHKD